MAWRRAPACARPWKPCTSSVRHIPSSRYRSRLPPLAKSCAPLPTPSSAQLRRNRFSASASGTKTSRRRATTKCAKRSRGTAAQKRRSNPPRRPGRRRTMATREREVSIPIDEERIAGTLVIPSEPRGLVLFAHGSGSSRFRPRNRFVAGALHRARFGTLLLDLLTPDEERVDAATGHLRFDIELLANRVVAATDWLEAEEIAPPAPLGYFGASTGAAAAL